MNTKPFVPYPYLHSHVHPQAYPKAYSQAYSQAYAQTYSQAYPLTQTYLHPQTHAALNPLTQTYRPPQTRPQTPPQPHPHPPAPSQPPTLSQVPRPIQTYSQTHLQTSINAEKFITKITQEARIAHAIRWALTERAVNLEELVHSEPGDFRWWWMGSQLRLTRRSVFLGLPSATLQIDRQGLWYLVEI